MDLDEAIKHEKELAGSCPDQGEAAHHKQLHSWLCSLKYQQTRDDWWKDYWEYRQRAERAERLLQEGLAPKEIGRAHHIKDLEEKNARLKAEVRTMQEKAEYFNHLLYATGLIVNCTGCVAGRPDKCEELTEEKVKTVEQISHRLRTWWENNKHRIPAPAPSYAELQKLAELHPIPQEWYDEQPMPFDPDTCKEANEARKT